FDLDDVFGTTMAPLEIVLRGTLVYWFLYLVFRFVLRRDTGSMGITDFLFVVLLGDAAQNGMIGNATSTADAVVFLSTLVFWNLAVDWLTSRSARFEKWLLPRRIVLVRDGVPQRRNLRREFISDEELMAKIRSHGMESLGGVKMAYLESDGEITVIKR